MSTGGVEVSFLQLQASITGVSVNRINHTGQLWIDGDAARFINGHGIVKRLVRLVRRFDDDCSAIVVFDSNNKFVAKLVADRDFAKWQLVTGPGLRQIETKVKRREAYVSTCAGEAEDEPEMLPSASVSLPAGVGWGKSF